MIRQFKIRLSMQEYVHFKIIKTRLKKKRDQ